MTRLRERVRQHRGRWMGTRPRCAAGTVIFLIFLSACSRTAPLHTIVTGEGGTVSFPVGEVGDGKVRFFTFQYPDKNINFFIRTDAGGKIHTHFDACYGCFQYKLGYYVENGDVVCRACRYRYHLADEVWDYIGACAPITLRHKTIKDQLHIDVSLLQRGERFF